MRIEQGFIANLIPSMTGSLFRDADQLVAPHGNRQHRGLAFVGRYRYHL
jgi:hypothetical protein